MKAKDFLTNGQVNQTAVDTLISKIGHIHHLDGEETYAEYIRRCMVTLNKKLSENDVRAHEHLVTKSPIWRLWRDADHILEVSGMKTDERGFLVQP